MNVARHPDSHRCQGRVREAEVTNAGAQHDVEGAERDGGPETCRRAASLKKGTRIHVTAALS